MTRLIQRITCFFFIGYIMTTGLQTTVMARESTQKQPKNETRAVDDNPSMDSFFILYQPYLNNIVVHKPICFLVGANPRESLFQFSFKYRFFNREKTGEKERWFNRIFMGYTQTSFWDLKSDSKPFEDSSYKPELFYISDNFNKTGNKQTGIFFQTGIRHESNGKSDIDSRSTNYLYIQPVLIFFHAASGYGIQISPQFWTYFANEKENNPDLKDYRGYVDLEIKLGKADNFIMETHFWQARRGTSTQIDVTYPLNRHFKKNFNFYLHGQYVNRLAENLLDYKERTNAFRLGLSIVR